MIPLILSIYLIIGVCLTIYMYHTYINYAIGHKYTKDDFFVSIAITIGWPIVVVVLIKDIIEEYRKK